MGFESLRGNLFEEDYNCDTSVVFKLYILSTNSLMTQMRLGAKVLHFVSVQATQQSKQDKQ